MRKSKLKWREGRERWMRKSKLKWREGRERWALVTMQGFCQCCTVTPFSVHVCVDHCHCCMFGVVRFDLHEQSSKFLNNRVSIANIYMCVIYFHYNISYDFIYQIRSHETIFTWRKKSNGIWSPHIMLIQTFFYCTRFWLRQKLNINF
jgi:hypothetical protein